MNQYAAHQVNKGHTLPRCGEIWGISGFVTLRCAVVTAPALALAVRHVLARRIRVATVWISCHNVFAASLPFGGYRQSGLGPGRAARPNAGGQDSSGSPASRATQALVRRAQPTIRCPGTVGHLSCEMNIVLLVVAGFVARPVTFADRARSRVRCDWGACLLAVSVRPAVGDAGAGERGAVLDQLERDLPVLRVLAVADAELGSAGDRRAVDHHGGAGRAAVGRVR